VLNVKWLLRWDIFSCFQSSIMLPVGNHRWILLDRDVLGRRTLHLKTAVNHRQTLKSLGFVVKISIPTS
jgi:hypothetical protein